MSKQFPHPFADMAKRTKQLVKDMPAIASGIAKDEFNRNFQAQGLRITESETQKWKKRQRQDRNRRGYIKAQRAILKKTGKLQRAMVPAAVPGMAVVQNNMAYARIHNRGGRIKGQMRAWATNRRSGLTRLRPSGSPAMMPARPFMVTTPLLLDNIGKAIIKEMDNIWNTAKSQ